MSLDFDPLAPGAPNYFLQLMFQEHGVPCEQQGDFLHFTGRRERLQGIIYAPPSVASGPNHYLLQLDVALDLDDGRTLVESCAGLGASPREAAQDALVGFTHGSLHTLIGAFFAPCSHVTEARWGIGGREWAVTLSTLLWRGQVPAETAEVERCLMTFERALQSANLAVQTHWVRFFYAQSPDGMLSSEVLFDNEPWPAVQNAIANFAWPATETYYSLRRLMVLRPV